MLVIQTSRHCSEQILTRQWEVKGKIAKLRKDSEGFYLYLFFKMKSCDDGRDKFSGVLKIVRDSAFRMGGGKFIPPTRNSEWKRSGEWFCASLWWLHEATLVRRSQTSWGDVDCYKWVEVGGCWAGGCSICKHQCLELQPGDSARR